MATNVIMPSLGLTMTEGTIVRWLVKEGEPVGKGQPLFEVSTDKATIEVEAQTSGILGKILVAAGETAPVTAVIAYITEPGEVVAAASGREKEPEPARPVVAQALELRQLPREPGQRIFISPRAKKAAQEKEIDYSHIQGTGPNGRIVEKDVLAYAALSPAVRVSPLAQKVAAACGVEVGSINGSGTHGKVMKKDVERALIPSAPVLAVKPVSTTRTIPLSGIRRIIAQRMAASSQTAPHVTLTTEVDITETVNLRKQLLPEIERMTGQKLSFNDIIIKVVSRALSEHPMMNATLQENEIHLLEDINIGIAVDAENGLVVPVLKQAHRKSLAEICSESKNLVNKARAGKLLPDDMSGGTFTISNLGMFEIDTFTPIINQPESGILGVGRMVDKPVVVEGQVTVRTMMGLSLSFDHRVIDGAPAARFLQRVKELLEKPLLLII
ncbi:MAG: dihydrolipoamide acetyltransferase family protein [Bacillota bacterium]